MVDAQTVEGQEIGLVTEYFAKIGVAGIDLTGSLNVGDLIRLQGHTTDFEQAVDSLQIETHPWTLRRRVSRSQPALDA